MASRLYYIIFGELISLGVATLRRRKKFQLSRLFLSQSDAAALTTSNRKNSCCCLLIWIELFVNTRNWICPRKVKINSDNSLSSISMLHSLVQREVIAPKRCWLPMNVTMYRFSPNWKKKGKQTVVEIFQNTSFALMILPVVLNNSHELVNSYHLQVFE